MRPLYITLEKSDLPTLIIDKEGSIGIGLYAKFKDLGQIVLVGGKKPDTDQNLVYLSYKQELPQIPGEKYSKIFYIVHSDKELEELLPALSEKTKEDKAKFFIVGERNLLPLHILEMIFAKSSECAVVLLGDMFGNPLNHRKHNIIEEIFDSAKNKKAIKLPGVGLSKIYPVLFEDAVIELIRLSFTFNKKIRLYFLHTQYSITGLGLSHMLQKESPLLKVDFEKGEVPSENDSIPIEGDYLLSQDYPATEKLLRAYKTFVKREEPQEQETKEEKYTEQKVLEKEFKKTKKSNSFIKTLFLSVLIFLIALIILPVGFSAVFVFLGESNFQGALKNIESGNLEIAKSQISFANNSFAIAKSILPIVSYEASFIGKKDVSSISEKINIAQGVVSDLSSLLQISDSLKKMVGEKSLTSNSLDKKLSTLLNGFYHEPRRTLEKSTGTSKNRGIYR